jgi:stage III sporulation protein AD
MEIMGIVGIGIAATIMIVIVKSQRPEMAMLISIITGIIIFILIATKLAAVVELISVYMKKTNVDTSIVATVLKIIGLAYICEIGAEICRDAEQGAIAAKIEMAGKVIIATIAVPIITSLLDLVIKIMP